MIRRIFTLFRVLSAFAENKILKYGNNIDFEVDLIRIVVYNEQSRIVFGARGKLPCVKPHRFPAILRASYYTHKILGGSSYATRNQYRNVQKSL